MEWATQTQTEYSGKLVVFTWKGYPRWPGIVLPAKKTRAQILAGSTVFIKPEPDIFDRTSIVATRLSLDKGDECKVKLEEKTTDFKPGKLGVTLDDDGMVTNVESQIAGNVTQAKQSGTKVGWRMCKLNGKMFSRSLFRHLRHAEQTYTVTFDTSQTNEWEDATIVSYINGSYNVRLRSSGKLRKGFARDNIVAPEDAERMGVRHGAKVKAGSQNHAAAKTKIVDPVDEGMVLIYSLGDEMYKWVRPQAIKGKWSSQRDVTYASAGYNSSRKSTYDHLAFEDGIYSGYAARAAADKWLDMRRQEKEAQDAEAARLHEYRSHHRSDAMPSTCRDRSRSPRREHPQNFRRSFPTQIEETHCFSTPEKLPAPAHKAYLRGEINVFSNQLGGGMDPLPDLGEFDEHCRRIRVEPAEVRRSVGSASMRAKLRRAYREVAFATHPDKKPHHVRDYWKREFQKLQDSFTYLSRYLEGKRMREQQSIVFALAIGC
eukprot:TRINITY_DN20507_c0_g1_i1.p1 TRINITY_DN20507_c0_g1~~TRINITY_DN20507_c0_g1_i1.p1  ORF type:complete len:508 (+),score=47.99 TRINITY_DN20507_c0_g1_i1:64-1524(+)